MKQRGFARQSVASGAVDARVDEIEAQTSAMLALSSTGGTLTADGTEQVLYIDNEPLGCWEPLTLWIDLDNMAAGDTTVIRAYHRARDGGTMKQWSYTSYAGADGGLANNSVIAKVDLGPNRHGFQVTLEQTAGVNRDYDWELFSRI